MKDRTDSDRAALAVFVAWLLVAGVILIMLGRGLWATADDWMLTGPRSWGDPREMLRDHNQHFSLVPVLIYKVLFSVVGFEHYWPYRFIAVTVHLTVVVLVRMLARNCGIRPWIATASAGSLALFNGGGLVVSQFQMPLGLALGLAMLIGVMRDELSRRTVVVATSLGIVAVATSGVALPVVLATLLVVWVRHGWRLAAVMASPIGVLYAAWWLWDSPTVPTAFGPTVVGLGSWIVSAIGGLLTDLGGGTLLGLMLAVAVIFGLILERRDAGHLRLLEPAALAAGGLLLMVLTYFGRGSDPSAATQSRFMYLGAVLAMPLIAVGWQGLANRQVLLGSFVAVPLFVGVIVGWHALRQEIEVARGFNNAERNVVAAMLRSPAATTTPDWVRPWWSTGFFGIGDTTWSYLRDAQTSGRLRLEDAVVTRDTDAVALIRLRLAQLGEFPVQRCVAHKSPIAKTLAPESRLGFRGGAPDSSWVDVRLPGRSSSAADFRAGPRGDSIQVVGDDPETGQPLRVEFSPGVPGEVFYLCE